MCYCHWTTLVVHDVGALGHFFDSKYGVIQGSALSMIAYDIGIIPLVYNICNVHPQVTQPYYSGNASARSYCAGLRSHL